MHMTIDAEAADAMGSHRLQLLADNAADGVRQEILLTIDGESRYHQGKEFVGRVDPPPPIRSFHVTATVEFRETGRSVLEAKNYAIERLEESDFIGSYANVEVTDDNAEVLAP